MWQDLVRVLCPARAWPAILPPMTFPSWLPILLGFLTAVGPVSTDMYLPAFPAIERALGLSEGSAQITLATWFAGLALGQITQGTLSDRFGRRGPLIAGTAIYALASAGCALAPNLFWLSALRAVAAFGGSASMVIPRAVVRDLADGHAAARLMSRLMLVMGAAPILAPTLGGVVLAAANWQAIFWICAAYGAICCVLVWRFLPDTLAADRRARLGPAALVSRYAGILRERGFITHAAQGGFGMFAMFAYIGGSPPVFIKLFRLSPPQYGMVFGLCAAGFIVASQINARILPRFGSNAVLRTGTLLFLGTAIALAGMSFIGPPTLWTMVPTILLMMTCMGFVMPNTVVGALSRHAAHAASASALMGTLQFVLGAASGIAVGQLTDGTPRGMAALILAGAIGATVADRLRPRP